VNILDQLAETKIREAQSRGDLENLPGSGKPLSLEDDKLIDPSLRIGYRLLKNAGYLPLEVQLLNELGMIEKLILTTIEPGEKKTLRLQLFSRMHQLPKSTSKIARRKYDYVAALLASIEQHTG